MKHHMYMGVARDSSVRKFISPAISSVLKYLKLVIRQRYMQRQRLDRGSVLGEVRLPELWMTIYEIAGGLNREHHAEHLSDDAARMKRICMVLLIRHGESVKVVQRRLGHKTAQETLDTYGHLWPDSDDQTRSAVETELFRPLGAGTDEDRDASAATDDARG